MSTSVVAADPVVQHLERALGLSFSGPRRERLLASVEAQRVAAGLSPDAFRDAASRPGTLFDRLVAQITVGETYFFRDRQQCELLRTVVLPGLAAQHGPGRRLAVWSAGCASGEEVYTLAALAAEAGLGGHCSIVGSDVSRSGLAKAEAATYGRWSMRSTTAEELAAHFSEQDGRFRVRERLRRRTAFYQRNLLDGPPPPGRFDVVLCRNLLIYLTRDAVQQVAAVLAGALTDGGWLITAAGDPPLVHAGLERVRTPYGLAYRRAGAAATARSGTAATATTRRIANAPTPEASPGAPVAGPPRPAAPALPPARPVALAAPEPARELVERVRALGDAGRLTEACAHAQAGLRAHPLDVELHYLAGALLLESGQLEEAATEAAAAVYLGPYEPAAHLLLGQVQHAAGQTTRAHRSFRNASRLLAGTPGGSLVALASGVPAGHLADVAQRHLDVLAAAP